MDFKTYNDYKNLLEENIFKDLYNKFSKKSKPTEKTDIPEDPHEIFKNEVSLLLDTFHSDIKDAHPEYFKNFLKTQSKQNAIEINRNQNSPDFKNDKQSQLLGNQAQKTFYNILYDVSKSKGTKEEILKAVQTQFAPLDLNIKDKEDSSTYQRFKSYIFNLVTSFYKELNKFVDTKTLIRTEKQEFLKDLKELLVSLKNPKSISSGKYIIDEILKINENDNIDKVLSIIAHAYKLLNPHATGELSVEPEVDPNAIRGMIDHIIKLEQSYPVFAVEFDKIVTLLEEKLRLINEYDAGSIDLHDVTKKINEIDYVIRNIFEKIKHRNAINIPSNEIEEIQ